MLSVSVLKFFVLAVCHCVPFECVVPKKKGKDKSMKRKTQRKIDKKLAVQLPVNLYTLLPSEYILDTANNQ